MVAAVLLILSLAGCNALMRGAPVRFLLPPADAPVLPVPAAVTG
ncbi:MAG: hypothetical protein Q4G49_14420 [Paracoccus sp. (in: a-proteobacteria)]|nr:hypothetical protein [Paracoccus sp. (in: a-proteobacteria)]